MRVNILYDSSFDDFNEIKRFSEALWRFASSHFWFRGTIPHGVEPFYIVAEDGELSLEPNADHYDGKGRDAFVDYWLDYYIDYTNEESREYSPSEFLRAFENAIDFVDYALICFADENNLTAHYDDANLMLDLCKKYGDELNKDWERFLAYRKRWGL